MKFLLALSLILVLASYCFSNNKESSSIIKENPKIVKFSKSFMTAKSNKKTHSQDMMISSDKKFIVGFKQSGSLKTEHVNGYTCDEFTLLISGNMSLTSKDGLSSHIRSGEAVSIPKGWKGTVSTSESRKVYVTYKHSKKGKKSAKAKTLSRAQIAGKIFHLKEATASKYNGSTPVIDYSSMTSSDGKFYTGMYASGPLTETYKEGYGYDEFMIFITGKVTLTSEDGTVTVINAGEAVSIPREWRGTWSTDGYTKIYVIY